MQSRLGLTREDTRHYRVAWIGGCVLFDTAKLRTAGGFDFWPQLSVNGAAHEAGLTGAVVDAMRAPAVDLSGKLSLAALCGLLERAALLVSNDTGPLHLALALGAPCVGIDWLTNLIESAPLRQERHRAAVSVRVHCPRCGAENLKTRCEHDDSFVADVPVEEVAALARELFRGADIA